MVYHLTVTDLISVCQSSRSLRSNDQLLLMVPRSCQKCRGDRAFSVAAPRLWNTLPLSIRFSPTGGRRLEGAMDGGVDFPADGGLSESRTVAGLTSPRTVGCRELRSAGWFWIGAGHSPDTEGSLPTSCVRWCLGGPRGDGN